MNYRPLLLICLAGLTACAHRSSPLNNVPLVWKPTSPPTSGAITLTGLRQSRIAVRPFTDRRRNPGEIGRNIEQKPVRAVTTRDGVGPWFSTQLSHLFSQYGLTLADGNPTAILQGEVTDFHVNEENTYVAQTGIRVTVTGPDGAVRWEGQSSGSAERFGRSYNLDNYYETLSDATIDTVSNLLRNPDFVRALADR